VLRIVPAGTGSAVWDNPHADQTIRRFMPPGRHHGPMIGILHLGAVRPTPGVLRDVVVGIGEDVRSGRYGSFTFFITCEDEATRSVIRDIAQASDVPVFVSSSPSHLDAAEPGGQLTARDRETLVLVYRAGGTVTAGELGKQLGIEQTTAGNRLTALHRKGYLQRVERPHPAGDLFIDPRTVRLQ
jgi:hypothetical protein